MVIAVFIERARERTSHKSTATLWIKAKGMSKPARPRDMPAESELMTMSKIPRAADEFTNCVRVRVCACARVARKRERERV